MSASTAATSAEGLEQLVEFSVRGMRLFGVLHLPRTSSPCNLCVLLLGGWSGTRVGPHGILVAAARKLAQMGFASFRFDYRGRGDSEGDLFDAHIGTMVEDAREAAALLLNLTGSRRTILLGICAGAQVALAAAPDAPSVEGLALWSPPPFHPDTPSEGLQNGRSSETRRRRGLLKQYAAKLFDPRTWNKLRSGQLQPRLILKILSGRSGEPVSSAEGCGWAGPKPDEELYELALPSLSCPALFIYGSADPERDTAVAYYRRLRNASSSTEFETIEGANHSFYSIAWKNEVIDRTAAWISGLCDAYSS